MPAAPAIPDADLARNLRCSVLDMAAYSVMYGIGEQNVALFALALGHGEALAGAAAVAPVLAGAALQLLTPRAVRWAGSLRRWTLITVVLQAVTWLPLIVGAITGRLGATPLIITVAFYWAFGMSSGAAWNTWMEHLVPAAMRPRYFGNRTRVGQLMVVLSMITAGLALEAGRARGRELQVFAALFVIAGVARLISAAFMAGQSDSPLPVEQHVRVGWRELLQRIATGRPDGRLLAFLIAMQFCVFTAGPYIAPYLMKQVGCSYRGFMLLFAVAFFARAVAAALWGRFAARFGGRRLLLIGALSIGPPVVVLALSTSFYWLLALQVLSGAAWAAYDLGVLLMLFETLDVRERGSLMTMYHFAYAAAQGLGAVLGGLALHFGGAHWPTYAALFAASGLIRFALLPLLPRASDVRAPLPVVSEPRL